MNKLKELRFEGVLHHLPLLACCDMRAWASAQLLPPRHMRGGVEHTHTPTHTKQKTRVMVAVMDEGGVQLAEELRHLAGVVAAKTPLKYATRIPGHEVVMMQLQGRRARRAIPCTSLMPLRPR